VKKPGGVAQAIEYLRKPSVQTPGAQQNKTKKQTKNFHSSRIFLNGKVINIEHYYLRIDKAEEVPPIAVFFSRIIKRFG
jgi:hypothetical protein